MKINSSVPTVATKNLFSKQVVSHPITLLAFTSFTLLLAYYTSHYVVRALDFEVKPDDPYKEEMSSFFSLMLSFDEKMEKIHMKKAELKDEWVKFKDFSYNTQHKVYIDLIEGNKFETITGHVLVTLAELGHKDSENFLKDIGFDRLHHYHSPYTRALHVKIKYLESQGNQEQANKIKGSMPLSVETIKNEENKVLTKEINQKILYYKNKQDLPRW